MVPRNIIKLTKHIFPKYSRSLQFISHEPNHSEVNYRTHRITNEQRMQSSKPMSLNQNTNNKQVYEITNTFNIKHNSI